MAKKTEIIKEPLDFGDFLLYNHEKLDRVINGEMGAQGRLSKGLGKNASPEAIIAEYDRLGGLIKTKGGKKVETGSFYDFDNKCAKEKPLVIAAKGPNRAGLKITSEDVGDELKPKRKKKVEEE